MTLHLWSRPLASAAIALCGALLTAASASAGITFVLPPGNPYNGLGAAMALEVTDTPPIEVDDDIHQRWVIARHVVRAADAIVILSTVKGGAATRPPGPPWRGWSS